MSNNMEQFSSVPFDQINGHGFSIGNNAPAIQPSTIIATNSPLFGEQNGPALLQNINGQSASCTLGGPENTGGDLHDLTVKLQAGISLTSSPAARRRSRPNGGDLGASVTRIIKTSDENVPTISTTVLSPEGGNGACARPKYSAIPGGSSSPAQNVLGRITIGDVTKFEGLPPVSPQKQVVMEPPKSDTFEIFVKNVDGKNHTCRVKTTDLVDDLLLQVQERLRLREDQFWLSHGKKFQKGNTLGYYRVSKHSTVYVMGPLVGGSSWLHGMRRNWHFHQSQAAI